MNKSKLNLMTIGKTGVGKSTLINAVFGEELAKTGIGKPVTQHCHVYTKEGDPLTIYDSKGLESGDNSGALNEIFSLIKTKNLSKESKDHIHICWYCVNDESNRLDDHEIKTIKDMRKEIPVILVITQALGGDRTKLFINEIEKMLDDNSIKIFPVMALNKKEISGRGTIDIPSYGLNELIEESYRLLPKAQAQIFASMQKISMKLKIERANRLAYRYAAAVAAAAWQPFPGPDAPIMIGIQTTMMGHIAVCFDYSASSAIASLGVTGLASILGRSLAARLAVSLLKLIPGFGTIAGGIINSTVGAAITLALAKLYIKALSSNVDIENIAAILKEGMETINLDEYKKAWKANKDSYSGSDEAKRILEEAKRDIEN